MKNKLLENLLRINARLDKISRIYGTILFILGIITLLVTLFGALVWSLDWGLLIRGLLLTGLGLSLTNEKQRDE